MKKLILLLIFMQLGVVSMAQDLYKILEDFYNHFISKQF